MSDVMAAYATNTIAKPARYAHVVKSYHMQNESICIVSLVQDYFPYPKNLGILGFVQ